MLRGCAPAGSRCRSAGSRRRQRTARVALRQLALLGPRAAAAGTDLHRMQEDAEKVVRTFAKMALKQIEPKGAVPLAV